MTIKAASTLTCAGAALLGVACPGGAWAQSDASAAPATAALQPPGDIVVTAMRKQQSLQNVPAAITAIGADTLQRVRLTSPGALASVVPNLNVNLPFGEGAPPSFVLRGVSTNDFTFNTSRPVAVFFDDGLRGLPALEPVPFFDVERIEVLRGPQGTLYGKNATGGAINVITARPEFKTDGYLTLGYGDYNRREARGAAETTLIDGLLAARLAFSYAKDDGVTKNVYPGAHDLDQTNFIALRGSLLFTPASNFEAVLRIGYFRSNASGYSFIPRNIDTSITLVDRAGVGFFEADTNSPPRRENFNLSFNLDMKWKLGEDYTLTSISTYDRAKLVEIADDDGLPVSLLTDDFAAHHVVQATQELRLASAYSGRFNWMGGAFYDYDSGVYSTTYRFFDDPIYGQDYGYGGYGFDQTNSLLQKRYSYSGYVRAEYKILPNLKLSGGARYSKDLIDVTNYNSFIGSTPVGGKSQFTIPVLVDEQAHPRFHKATFEAGLDWKVSDRLLAYASFKQGYRTGAVNGQAYFDVAEISTVKPETVNGYELGLKSELFDRHLTFNLAGFRSDYSNQQFLDAVNGLTIIRNAKKSRIWGVEADAHARLTDALALTLAAGWLNPKYKSLTLSGVDLSGNQLIGASKWTLSGAVDLRLARLKQGDVALHLDGNYASRYFFDAFNQPSLSEDGYVVFNGRLSFDAAGHRVGAALWAKNLLQTKYFVYAYPGTGYGLGFDAFAHGLPRTFGGELSYRF